MAFSTMPPGVPPGVPLSTAEPHSPDVSEPPNPRRAVERKLAGARARLFARLDELGRRVAKARDAVDVPQLIRDHPLAAVGISLSIGALVGLPRGNGRLRRELTALLTALAVNAVRSSVSDWLLDQLRGSSADRSGTATRH
jgi:hypothetical protein